MNSSNYREWPFRTDNKTCGWLLVGKTESYF